mgnify:CR=1 FL=1|tara:strand:+ start:2650 stop:2994 length:345 start_codon:yes stop_codon:yes gene_type:complete
MVKTKSPYLFEGQGSAIDAYLNSDNEVPVKQAKNWGYFDKENPQHKRIQANLRAANIVVENARHVEVADMLGWFNRFLKSNKSPIKKPLKEMTPDEVSKIIVALDGVVVWKNSI